MLTVGSIGYLATGLMYALLTLLMFVAWIARRGGGALVAATFVSVLWASTLAAQTSGYPVRPDLIFVVEVLRAWAWVGFLAYLLGKVGTPRWLRTGANLSGAIVLVAGFMPAEYLLVPETLNIAMLGGLALALAGLLLIEQLYRNSTPDSRWALKPLVLGVGGLFAFDLFLYSQAILFNVIDATTWLARGAVNVIFVPMIAIAARRNPTWKLDIFVSRQVVFYTTTLVAVGAYLVLMSLGGYLLIQFGGDWGAISRIVFFVGAVVVLLTLLLSNTLRARAKVFLSKHFFRNKYDYRQEWLRLVSTLSGFGDSTTRQNAIKAMAQIVDSPAGVLWVLDREGDRYRVAAVYGRELQAPDLDIADAVVAFIRKDGWLFDLAEYRSEPEVYGNLSLPGWLSSIATAWLIVPLMLRNELQGLVLLTETSHVPTLNYEDRDLLKTVGSHVAVHLAQEESDELLAEAQQFEAYNRFTAFLMHDLNNLIAQQSLIVANAEKHKRNPEFVDDAMDTITASVERMKRVMAQLKRSDSGQSATLRQLKHLVSAAVDRCASGKPVPQLNLDGVEASVRVDPDQFIMVLSHLIKNAQEATTSDESVNVSLRANGLLVEVVVEDNGTGMEPEFVRERLFKPFDSTKGARGMGIGAYQARDYARKSGGDLIVDSQPGIGTSVTLRLPVAGDS